MTANLPLTALRAFEAAARAGGFVAAGTELGVTSAAVSQQVRALEDHLGRKLFLRQGNRIVMTDAGRALYPRLELALAELTRATDEIRLGPGRPRLVLSVLPSLAELWLAPALAGFDAAGLELRVEEDPAIIARAGADLRLTYGGHAYPGHHVEPLFRDRVMAVAAPGALPAGGVVALADAAFIHTEWGPSYASQPSWAGWFAEAGSPRRPDPRLGLTVGSSGLAVAAARAGLGMALVPERMAAADLRAGRLAAAAPGRLALSHDYVLVRPAAQPRRAAVQALVAHLKAVAGRDPQAGTD